MKKKLSLLVAALFAFVALTAFNNSKTDYGYEINRNPNFKNLKILPKDISDDELKGVMQSFSGALGVKCSYCHVPGNDGKMDFASDNNVHKITSRDMMKMTSKINKKYFGQKNPMTYSVNCFTCHQGETKPVTHPVE
ncbi:MAG: c-type cytochrome [Weeksellaceae bacterium]|jgi:hypothetical protein|nr:c-type cytochrome [Weeksellaceae bacterium]MDX9705702.1 c-type cytochrome [Weeksellaceae bacterium]